MPEDARHRKSIARKQLDSAISSINDSPIYLAWTGKGDDANTVLVPGRPGFIFVRIPKKIENGQLTEYTEAQAYSAKEFRHGVPVELVIADDKSGRYEVRSIWKTGGVAGHRNAINESVTTHHESHELYSTSGGHDPVILDTAQLRNLQITPTNPPSSRVMLNGGWYIWKDRNVHWVDSQEIELASYVPTGTISYDSLWLDPITETIIHNIRNNNPLPPLQLPIEELVIWPTSNYIPLACVRLIQNVYNIGWSYRNVANIIDMRPHQAMMPGDMLPAGHPLDPSGGYHTGTLRGWNVTIEDPGMYYTSTTAQEILENELGPTRGMVKVSQDDDILKFLQNKVVAGNNIAVHRLNIGGDEQLQISSSGTGGSSGTFYQTVQDDGLDENQRLKLNFAHGVGLSVDVTDDPGNNRSTVTGSLDYLSLLEDTSPASDDFIGTYDTSTALYKRSKLSNILSAISAFYQTVQDKGTDKTQRHKLNFNNGIGISVAVADDAGSDRSTVSGSLDYLSLTLDSSPSSNDIAATYDISAETYKRILLSSLNKNYATRIYSHRSFR